MLTTLLDRHLLAATLTRYRSLLTGRHHLDIQIAPTITGYWAWNTTCITCDLTRSGAETSHAAAHAAAHTPLGRRDTHTGPDRPYLNNDDPFTQRLTDAGHPPLRNWKGIGRVTLPRLLAGTGYTVATDGAANRGARTGGWGFITNTGWCGHGTITPDHNALTHIAEFTAIERALRIYPLNCTITLLVDNVGVGSFVQDIIELAATGKKFKTLTIPDWADRDAVTNIKSVAQHSTINVRWTRSTTNPLHNLADTLARAAIGSEAKKAGWKPGDIEHAATHCGPTCTRTHHAA